MPRPRTRCERPADPLARTLPARRAACRSRLRPLDEPARTYIAGWEPDGRATVDVVDLSGALTAHWTCGSDDALAVALLADATGHRPKEATAVAFRREVVDHLPRDGFALSSQDVCAWLLLRAIERLER